MSGNRQRIGWVMGATLVLSACQMGKIPGLGAADKASAPVETMVPGDATAATPAGGERDVEAPGIFKMTDKALWDGRPSLGGVWVAHTSVKDPERVMMRNLANGKTVVGALFRREVDNPGPSLQLSSDAAEALGLLAGQPATIEVVALKRVETPAPAPAAPADVKPDDKIAATTLPAAKPAGSKSGAKAAAAATAGAAAKADPVSKTAAAAIERATKGGKAATAVAPAALPATSAAGGGEPAKRPFLQIGIFSVEANAKKAAAQMQKAGLPAQVKGDTSNGKSFWRVIIGPSATVGARDAAAAKVKGLGYPDAYPVTK